MQFGEVHNNVCVNPLNKVQIRHEYIELFVKFIKIGYEKNKFMIRVWEGSTVGKSAASQRTQRLSG